MTWKNIDKETSGNKYVRSNIDEPFGVRAVNEKENVDTEQNGSP